MRAVQLYAAVRQRSKNRGSLPTQREKTGKKSIRVRLVKLGKRPWYNFYFHTKKVAQMW